MEYLLNCSSVSRPVDRMNSDAGEIGGGGWSPLVVLWSVARLFEKCRNVPCTRREWCDRSLEHLSGNLCPEEIDLPDRRIPRWAVLENLWTLSPGFRRRNRSWFQRCRSIRLLERSIQPSFETFPVSNQLLDFQFRWRTRSYLDIRLHRPCQSFFDLFVSRLFQGVLSTKARTGFQNAFRQRNFQFERCTLFGGVPFEDRKWTGRDGATLSFEIVFLFAVGIVEKGRAEENVILRRPGCIDIAVNHLFMTSSETERDLLAEWRNERTSAIANRSPWLALSSCRFSPTLLSSSLSHCPCTIGEPQLRPILSDSRDPFSQVRLLSSKTHNR